MQTRNDTGIVVIGRNEGERLRACLRSIDSRQAAVYVDSGSSDSSVELANSFGFDVVELDRSAPFTAARARNAGLTHIRGKWSEVRFVQVVDGDCELASNWIESARAHLLEHPDLAVVFGRRRERYRDVSCYNVICDDEWNGAPGPALSCGGDAMLRVEALLSVNGYNPALIAGEEPDLCLRLRSKGWRIERLPENMTTHDADIHKLSNWWRRTERSGHAFAQLVQMHARRNPEWTRQLGSIAFWSSVILLSAMLLVSGGIWKDRLLFSTGAGLALTLVAQILRIAVRKRRGGLKTADSLKVASLMMLGKLAQLQGAARFYAREIRGTPKRLIEYKGP